MRGGGRGVCVVGGVRDKGGMCGRGGGGVCGTGLCMCGGGMHGRRACVAGGGERAWLILRDTVNERVVRILLECILVKNIVLETIQS